MAIRRRRGREEGYGIIGIIGGGGREKGGIRRGRRMGEWESQEQGGEGEGKGVERERAMEYGRNSERVREEDVEEQRRNN